MASELIRLMQEGMTMDYYDGEWCGRFFEIHESRVPLTAEEHEVFIQFLAHGYIKEWDTEYVEHAVDHVEPDFDLWMKVFKQLPESDYDAYFFYQLLDFYNETKAGLPADLRWYQLLADNSDSVYDEQEEVLDLLEDAYRQHTDPGFRKEIINIANSLIEDFGYDRSDYYDRVENDDLSDNFNHGEGDTDEFAKALIEAYEAELRREMEIEMAMMKAKEAEEKENTAKSCCNGKRGNGKRGKYKKFWIRIGTIVFIVMNVLLAAYVNSHPMPSTTTKFILHTLFTSIVFMVLGYTFLFWLYKGYKYLKRLFR